MMKLQSIALTVFLCTSSAAALAEGSAEAGQAKAATCVACHGVNGNSSNPQWPNLAGQHPLYIERQLQAFKTGTRQDPLMSPMAAPLSEDDMADLAAYFAAQVPTGLEAEPSKVNEGEKLFRGGDPVTGVPACAACHGPAGHGNPLANYPAIGGQHGTYVVTQLKAYRAGTRKTDQPQNQMMRNVASAMSDSQIEAVAAYLQGLR